MKSFNAFGAMATSADHFAHPFAVLAGESVKDLVPTNGKAFRKWTQQNEQDALDEFLEEHKFKRGICAPRSKRSGWIPFMHKEKIYPIHVAAKLGKCDILRILLRAQVDSNQKTSDGRSALDMAREADVNGSHRNVIALLQQPVMFLGVRELMAMK